MKKYTTAFFMAWGGFLSIPCPCKKWDTKLKNLMLGFLPSVGFIIGIVLTIIAVILSSLRVPHAIEAMILTVSVFALSGFIHMDGFMDVSDAIFSRRDLEERRRILKDSSVGAFAVIFAVFLILSSFVVFNEVFEREDALFLYRLAAIPVSTRMVAACAVLSFDPMQTSQYAESHEEERTKAVGIALGTFVIYILLLAIWIAIRNNPFDIGKLMATSVFTVGGSLLACLFAKNNLKGMNGDIAGFSICTGGLVGLLSCLIV
jgi:adenosylcobinamide-GDP ribazoletransferase